MPFGVFVCRITHCYSCRCIEDNCYIYNKVSFRNRRISGQDGSAEMGFRLPLFPQITERKSHKSRNKNPTNHGIKIHKSRKNIKNL